MTKDSRRFSGHGDEPLIADMLNDPIVHLVMRRDRVTEMQLIALVESTRRSLAEPANLGGRDRNSQPPIADAAA